MKTSFVWLALVLPLCSAFAPASLRAGRNIWKIQTVHRLQTAAWDPASDRILIARAVAEENRDLLHVYRFDPVDGTSTALVKLPLPSPYGSHPFGSRPFGSRPYGPYRDLDGTLYVMIPVGRSGGYSAKCYTVSRFARDAGGAFEFVVSGGPGQSYLARMKGDQVERIPILSDRHLGITNLALAPGGERFVVESECGVAQLVEARDKASGSLTGYRVDPIPGEGVVPHGPENLTDDGSDDPADWPWWDPRVSGSPGHRQFASISPEDLAVTPAGDLVVADPAYGRLVRFTPPGRTSTGQWELTTLAGNSGDWPDGDGHPDARDSSLGPIKGCLTDSRGHLFTSGDLLWQFTADAPQGTGSWRSLRIGGLPRGYYLRGADGSIPGRLRSADEALAQHLEDLALLDSVPGDGLLAREKDTLYYVGPAPTAAGDSDRSLARLVRSYRRKVDPGQEALDHPGAARILAGLRKHVEAGRRGALTPGFEQLTKERKPGPTLRRLPHVLERLIFTYKARPRILAFRAALAIQAATEGLEPLPAGVGVEPGPALIPAAQVQGPSSGPNLRRRVEAPASQASAPAQAEAPADPPESTVAQAADALPFPGEPETAPEPWLGLDEVD